MDKSTNFAETKKGDRKMKYSRSQINKAGDSLINDPFGRQQAVEIVTDWRQSHLPVLRELNDELTEFLVANGVKFEFSSHRIKRMQSIVEKLRNSPDMGLGGMQDIGGIRFVFPDTETLELAEAVLHVFSPKNFELKKVYDYITNPKESGYRSIHYVYKCKSENPDHNGLQIELQIRNKLQHSWAMAVETASLISGTSLKASIQDGSVWRDFFKLVSAIFSKREGKPVLDIYTGHTDELLCREYFAFNEHYKLVDTLKALRVTVASEKHKQTGDRYCVLNINYVTRRVSFRFFETEEEALASETFSRMEQSITSGEAALMVSMKKIEELWNAYPSYFLDTAKFIDVLADFETDCMINHPR